MVKLFQWSSTKRQAKDKLIFLFLSSRMGRLKRKTNTSSLVFLLRDPKLNYPSGVKASLACAGIGGLIGELLAWETSLPPSPRPTLMVLQGHSARVRQVITKWIAPQWAGLESYCQVNREIFCLRLPSFVKCLYLLLNLGSCKLPPHIPL